MKLKITNKTFNKNIDEIEVGELFIVSENDKDKYSLFKGTFMKVRNRKDNRNAVRLNDGELYCINNNILLQIVNGTLII